MSKRGKASEGAPIAAVVVGLLAVAVWVWRQVGRLQKTTKT